MPSRELADRFLTFAKSTVVFCKSLETDTVTRPLVSQLVRSATSIGANYMEAQNAISRNDFRAKIYICKKESQETIYWLTLLEPLLTKTKISELQTLQQEATEIVKIIQTITNKLA